MSLGQALLIPGIGSAEDLSQWSNYKRWTGQAITGTRRLLVPLSEDADIVATAQRDGSDIRITASDGETQLPFELVGRDQYVAPRGTWTYHSRPTCVSKTDGSKMWVSFLSGDDGYAIVGEYDASTEAWSYFRLRDTGFQRDDHSNPVLYYRTDGKIFCAYVRHDQENKIFYRISTAANDASAFDAEQQVVFNDVMSYCFLMKMGSKLYMISRRGPKPQEWVIRESSDEGSTWGADNSEVNFWDTTDRAYIQAQVNSAGDKIHFLGTNGPDTTGPSSLPRAAYHFYYDGTNWFESDGTNITASLPLDTSDLDATSSHIWSENSGDDSMRQVDIVESGGTFHALASIYYDDSDVGRDWMYFSYDEVGGAWRAGVVVASEGDGIGDSGGGSSQEGYHGASRFANDDGTTIWMSRQVGSVYEISKWENSGTAASPSWSQTETITSGSTYHNFRPQPVVGGAVTDFQVVWCGFGPYTGFEPDEWRTGVQGWPGRRTWDLAFVKSDSEELVVYYGRSGVRTKSNAQATWGGDYVFVYHGGWQRGQRLDIITPSIGTVGTPQLNTYWAGSNVSDRLPSVNTDFTGQFDTTAGREDCEWWDFASNNINPANWTAITIQAWGKYTALYSNEHYLIALGGQSTAGMFLRTIPLSLDEMMVRVATTNGAEDNDGVTFADDGTWRMAVGVFDGSVPKIDARVNTTEATEVTPVGTALDSDTPRGLEIGNYPPDLNTGWSGDLAGFRITNQTALSKAVTDDDYNMVTNGSWGAFGTEKETPFVAVDEPEDIFTSLRFFWRADALSAQSDDTDVTTWTSREGNTYDLTQGTASQKPHYRDGTVIGINSQPVVAFDASASQFLRCTDAGLLAVLNNVSETSGLWWVVCRFPSLDAGGTYFVTASRDSVINKYLMFGKTATTHDLHFYYRNGGSGDVDMVADDEVLAIDTDYLLIEESDGSAHQMRSNGVLESTTPAGNGNWFGDITGDLGSFVLGSRYGSGGDTQHTSIYIAEVGYASDRSDAKRSSLYAYISDRYGITLP